MILSNSKIFNDMEHRAASLRQLSFLFIAWMLIWLQPAIRAHVIATSAASDNL